MSFVDGHNPDLINIDEGSQHNSKTRVQPSVNIDRDDEEGDDDDEIDGSGSGSSEVNQETTTLYPTQFPGQFLATCFQVLTSNLKFQSTLSCLMLNFGVT